MASDKGSGPSALQKRSPTKRDSNEASEVCIKRKNTVHVGRYKGSLRGSGPALFPRGILLGAFLLVFLRPVISICPIHSPYLAYLRILLCVHVRLLAKTDSTEKVHG